MNKLAKLLNKYNKKNLYKLKTSKKIHKEYEPKFKRQGLFFKLRDDFDFIKFEVIKTSYDNMRSIQEEFFKIKLELDEYWDVVNYKNKNFLVYKQLSKHLNKLKHFYVDDKRYFIAYFDDLINAYYDHEMLMFDKEAFRKWLYDFEALVIDPNKYGLLPLEANFSSVKLTAKNQKAYVLYSEQINRFYYVSKDKLSFGLIKSLNDQQIDDISKMIILEDKKALVTYLIENELGSKRLLKRLKRKLRKL